MSDMTTRTKLSPTMGATLAVARECNGLYRGVATVGTIVALMDRGYLREYDPHRCVHPLATTPAQVHGEALLENLRRARAAGEFDYLNDAAWGALLAGIADAWAKHECD